MLAFFELVQLFGREATFLTEAAKVTGERQFLPRLVFCTFMTDHGAPVFLQGFALYSL